MAFHIVEMILSFFHSRSKATKNQKPCQEGSKSSTTNPELPPPYSPIPINSGPGKEKSSPVHNSRSVVQVCPHEVLNFERLQRIANLPNFKTNSKKIDALASASEHHHRGHAMDTGDILDSCKPLGPDVSVTTGYSSIVGSLKGFGTYVWKSTGPVPGALLSFHWEMSCLENSKVQCESPAHLQTFLEKANIWLCPHKKISDLNLTNAMYGIINPLGKPVDPIDRYLAQEVGHDCAVCGTQIKVCKRKDGSSRKCRVDTVRFLGTAEHVNDPLWHGQCKSS